MPKRRKNRNNNNNNNNNPSNAPPQPSANPSAPGPSSRPRESPPSPHSAPRQSSEPRQSSHPKPSSSSRPRESSHPRQSSKPREPSHPNQASSPRDPQPSPASGLQAKRTDPSAELAVVMKDLRISPIRPMARPAFGAVGKPIRVEANFFRMKLPSNLVVQQYAVSIAQWRHRDEIDPQKRKRGRNFPEDGKAWIDFSHVEPIFFNRAVIDQVIQRHTRTMGCRIAYDGRSIAYAPRPIQSECLGTPLDLTVGREGNPPTDQERRDEKTIRVKVTFDHVKVLRFDDIKKDLRDTLQSGELLAAIDSVLANSPRKHFVQIGRSFYSDREAFSLGRTNRDGRGPPAPISAWRGFYQSARLSQLGLVVNLDQSFTAFWNRGGKCIMELIQDANGGRPLDPNDRYAMSAISQKLKLLKLKASHTGITYKFHGLSGQSADRISFNDSSGRKTSITEYFHRTYNIRLRYGHMPCVRTHPKKDTFLPMELMYVLEAQRVSGLLSPDETAAMVRHASSKPHVKKAAAQRIMRELDHNHDSLVKDFGFYTDDRLVQVPARILPPPRMQFSRDAVQVAQGIWKPNSGFVRPAELHTWAIIVEGRIDEREVGNFMREMQTALRKGGMKVSPPKVHYVDRRGKLSDKLHEVVAGYHRNKSLWVNGHPLELVLLVKDGRDTKSYREVKNAGDIDLGVVTQVCLVRNVKGQRLNQYCDNVVLKINAKLGGLNSVPVYKGIAPDVDFLNSPHMILGADVTHPMPGGRTPSVAALVGSRDKDCAQYGAAIRTQAGRKEVIEDLGGMFKEVYQHWRNNFRGKWHVHHVIMFRDGVSEGQFEEVMSVEVQALRRACMEISEQCRPRITYIIVTKRHHTRFFGDNNITDRSGNIPAGTVVDRDVTSKEYYDFYLNSHTGIQGTSRPSKYTVLIDENNIGVDKLQAYVYKLAHSFARCNRAVSMVSPAYYAHLLAFRARVYLGEGESESGTQASSSSQVPPTPVIAEALRRRLFFV